MKAAQDIYRRTQHETSSDRASMGVLLGALVQSLHKTKTILEQGERQAAHTRLIASQRVLVALREGVNPEAGELAQRLEALYTFCEQSLGQANITGDAKLLDDAIQVLIPLRDGFQGMADPHREA